MYQQAYGHPQQYPHYGFPPQPLIEGNENAVKPNEVQGTVVATDSPKHSTEDNNINADTQDKTPASGEMDLKQQEVECLKELDQLQERLEQKKMQDEDIVYLAQITPPQPQPQPQPQPIPQHPPYSRMNMPMNDSSLFGMAAFQASRAATTPTSSSQKEQPRGNHRIPYTQPHYSNMHKRYGNKAIAPVMLPRQDEEASSSSSDSDTNYGMPSRKQFMKERLEMEAIKNALKNKPFLQKTAESDIYDFVQGLSPYKTRLAEYELYYLRH